MRSLGEFCGHVLRGVRTDPAAPAARVARERVEEEMRETPAGRVLVRRTVIEEILVPGPLAAEPGDSPDATRDDARRRESR